ncbi:hypothetical protein [Streptomyces griseus]|nr:hypothetical protein [Streptomyces griseus]
MAVIVLMLPVLLVLMLFGLDALEHALFTEAEHSRNPGGANP